MPDDNVEDEGSVDTETDNFCIQRLVYLRGEDQLEGCRECRVDSEDEHGPVPRLLETARVQNGVRRDLKKCIFWS